MDKKQRDELTQLITPLQQWLVNNIHPHHTLIISGERFELLATEYCVPINEKVNIPD